MKFSLRNTLFCLGTSYCLQSVKQLNTYASREFPFLSIVDLRFYITLLSLSLLFLIFANLCKPNCTMFSEQDLGSFALCFQGLLVIKYIFLAFALILLPSSLEFASNTIEFTKPLYLIMFALDMLVFFGLSERSSKLKHTFSWKPYLSVFAYYIIYNTFSSLGFDIYKYQIDFRDSSILFVFFVVIASFYSCVICPSINSMFGANPNDKQ